MHGFNALVNTVFFELSNYNHFNRTGTRCNMVVHGSITPSPLKRQEKTQNAKRMEDPDILLKTKMHT